MKSKLNKHRDPTVTSTKMGDRQLHINGRLHGTIWYRESMKRVGVGGFSLNMPDG